MISLSRQQLQLPVSIIRCLQQMVGRGGQDCGSRSAEPVLERVTGGEGILRGDL